MAALAPAWPLLVATGLAMFLEQLDSFALAAPLPRLGTGGAAAAVGVRAAST